MVIPGKIPVFFRVLTVYFNILSGIMSQALYKGSKFLNNHTSNLKDNLNQRSYRSKPRCNGRRRCNRARFKRVWKLLFTVLRVRYVSHNLLEICPWRKACRGLQSLFFTLFRSIQENGRPPSHPFQDTRSPQTYCRSP